MKNLLLTMILTTVFCNAQTAQYNKIDSESSFKEYMSKAGNTIKVGDTLNIGYPRAGDRFMFITQGNEPTGTVIANAKVVITKIKTIGNKNRGYKTYLLFKGYGMIPVYIDYESAFETGELK
ncbi:hypothetical protein [Flavobacterium sp. CFS9]